MLNNNLLVLLLAAMAGVSLCKWHCGADNMPFTDAASLAAVYHSCPDSVIGKINTACQVHDSCYHGAKGRGEDARHHCDDKFCRKLYTIDMDWYWMISCKPSITVVCGAVHAGGWIAQGRK